MKRTVSLRTRLNIYVLSVTFFFLAASCAAVIYFSSYFLNFLAKDNMLFIGENIRQQFKTDFIYYDYSRLLGKSEKLLKNRKSDFIALYDSEKRPLVELGFHAAAEHTGILGNQAVVTEIIYRSAKYHAVSIPVMSPDHTQVFGFILYGRSDSKRTSLLTTIFTFIVLALIIVLILALLWIRIIMKKALEPFRRLCKKLDFLQDDGCPVSPEKEDGDELLALDQKIAHLLESLHRKEEAEHSTVNRLNRRLSEKSLALDNASLKLKKALQELSDSQKKAIQSEKQKSLTAIVAGFAHEINNPLTGIMGYLDLMELQEDISPYIRSKLQHIKNQTFRIRNIIRELNQLNPEIQQSKLQINLANLLEKLLRILKNKNEYHHVQIETHFGENPVTVYGNHFSLWQVFEGIMENSLEALQEKKDGSAKVTIHLKESVDRTQAVIEIFDNGGGFDNIDKAFDPFYTTKNRTQKKGIGLSIAYNLIQEHKGNILIRNTEDGANTTIYLPLYIAERKPEIE